MYREGYARVRGTLAGVAETGGIAGLYVDKDGGTGGGTPPLRCLSPMLKVPSQRVSCREATEGVLCKTLLPSFSCENATSLGEGGIK